MVGFLGSQTRGLPASGEVYFLLIFICVCVYICMCVCVRARACVYSAHKDQKRLSDVHVTLIIPCGSWEQNLGPLQEQQMLLIVEQAISPALEW